MILSNQKRHFWKNQVKNLKVPLLPELAVNKIWPEAVQMPQFSDYVPSDWTANSKKTERSFFWSILISLAPEYVDQLVKDVR